MNKKVYLVTQGSYSDYHICGVFDKEELAQQFIDMFNGGGSYDSMDIDEWSLNPHKKQLGKGYSPYFLRMTKDGEVSDIRTKESSYGFVEEVSYGFDIKKNMYNHCLAKNKDHAIKITNELRASLIASNQWKD